MIERRRYPQIANDGLGITPLPQTPTPRGLCPRTAELRLSSAQGSAPLGSPKTQRIEGFALCYFLTTRFASGPLA